MCSAARGSASRGTTTGEYPYWETGRGQLGLWNDARLAFPAFIGFYRVIKREIVIAPKLSGCVLNGKKRSRAVAARNYILTADRMVRDRAVDVLIVVRSFAC